MTNSQSDYLFLYILGTITCFQYMIGNCESQTSLLQIFLRGEGMCTQVISQSTKIEKNLVRHLQVKVKILN